ncbi:MAG: hypothetical protein PHR45_04915 [Muribaculaceae bacterium]|nr:hypothetical protein [Muribaculaceae bacterium]
MLRVIYTLFLLIFLTISNISAQDYDDIYYDSSKDNHKIVVRENQINYISNESELVNGRDVDEYNRRDYYDPSYENDSINYVDSLSVSSSNYNVENASQEDYQYTRRIKSFYNPVVIIETTNPYIYDYSYISPLAYGYSYYSPAYMGASWNWYSPWSWGYDPWYNPYWSYYNYGYGCYPHWGHSCYPHYPHYPTYVPVNTKPGYHQSNGGRRPGKYNQSTSNRPGYATGNNNRPGYSTSGRRPSNNNSYNGGNTNKNNNVSSSSNNHRTSSYNSNRNNSDNNNTYRNSYNNRNNSRPSYDSNDNNSSRGNSYTPSSPSRGSGSSSGGFGGGGGRRR